MCAGSRLRLHATEEAIKFNFGDVIALAREVLQTFPVQDLDVLHDLIEEGVGIVEHGHLQ
jgi:hypothetical protein